MTKALLSRRPGPLFSDQLFRRLFEDEGVTPQSLLSRWNEGLGEDTWLPAVDVRESDEAFVFTAELPGLIKEDVTITIEDKVLTVSGERKFEGKKENQNYHRIERAYGTFARSFSLPHEVDQDEIAATFENGLLTISIPKAEAIKPHRIEIS